MATRAKKGREAISLGGVPPEVIAGARLVLAGAKVLPASEQAGCSRHAISRLLAKPGAAAAIKAHDGAAADVARSHARARVGVPGPLEAHNDQNADQAQQRRERVWADHLARVPREHTQSALGISVSGYYALLREARDLAAKAFRAEAGSMVAEIAEFYRDVMWSARDASVAALSPPPLPDGLVDKETEAKLLMPDHRAHAACAAVAIKAAEGLAMLAGVREPKGELPTAEAAKRLAEAASGLSARLAARVKIAAGQT